MSDKKRGFELKDLPNAFLGMFGIRTEEEVRFQVREKDGAFEIRDIEAHLELSSVRSGKRSEATNKSFDDLLAFIKGHNRSSKKYSMTAPVWEEQQEGKWRTSFYVKDKMSSAPTPSDSSLEYDEKSPERFAVYRFSGQASEPNVAKAENKLLEWVSRKNLKAIGAVRLAQFDPPFALPFLRRNEVQVRVC